MYCSVVKSGGSGNPSVEGWGVVGSTRGWTEMLELCVCPGSQHPGDLPCGNYRTWPWWYVQAYASFGIIRTRSPAEARVLPTRHGIHKYLLRLHGCLVICSADGVLGCTKVVSFVNHFLLLPVLLGSNSRNRWYIQRLKLSSRVSFYDF
jgi:hypothetical protein